MTIRAIALLALLGGLVIATYGNGRSDRVGTVTFLVGLAMVILAAVVLSAFVFGHTTL